MPKDNYIQKVLAAGLGSKSLYGNLQMRTEAKLYPEIEIQQTTKNRLTQFTDPWDDETIIEEEDRDEVFTDNASNKEQEFRQRNIGEEIDGGYHRGEVSKKTLYPEGEDISNLNAMNAYVGNEDNLGDSQEEIVEKSPEIGRNHTEEQNVQRKESEFKDRIPEVEIIKNPLMKKKVHTHSLPEDTQDISSKTQEETKIITPITKDDINSGPNETPKEVKQPRAGSFLKEKNDKSVLPEKVQSAPRKKQEEKIQEISDIGSDDKDLSSIRSEEKRSPMPLRDKRKYYDKQDYVTIEASPKVSLKEKLDTDSDFKELKIEQISESNEEATLAVKERKNMQDIEIKLPAKSSETKTIEGMKEETEERENVTVQPKGQKIMGQEITHQKERTLMSSSLKEKMPVYETDVPGKPVTVIQSLKDKNLSLNTSLYSESLNNNMNHILKMADNIAAIDEKLTAHIRKEHSKPAKPTFLPKRPPSRNLGGWNYLERSYLE